VIVVQCGWYGVMASGTGGVGKCTNMEVRQCGESGVVANNGASITLIGAKTTVHHNCTKGHSNKYGLGVYNSSSSTIQFVSPLTKETVSTDNGGGGNWGAAFGGDINQIKTIADTSSSVNGVASGETKTTSTSSPPTPSESTVVVRVPEECSTLKVAVKKVYEDSCLTTIVVGKGEHLIDGYYLEISSAMNIVGDPGMAKEEIVVVGGIEFKKGIQGNCHLQHMTLRQAKETGVWGQSLFTMKDVIVEQCAGDGVWASGTGGIGRCTNVEVRQCGRSGVVAGNGASLTLIGAKTTAHHNCTKGSNKDYGLEVHNSSSTIILVSPLTKETASTDNGGGGNWGASHGGDTNQITAGHMLV